MAWINLSEDYDFTDLAYEEFTPGKVLMFNYEGSEISMKVKRIDKEKRKIWVENVTMYKPEEVEVTDKELIDKI